MTLSENKQFEGAERTLVWPGDPARRASFRLDHPTWAAIDRIAALRGQRWTQWVRELLGRHPGAVNMRAVIRAAVVDELLQNSIFSMLDERAELLAAEPPALLANSASMDDDELEEDLAASVLDGAPVETTAFSVQTGTDPHGRACLWIRSNVRGGRHLVVPLEMTIDEQATRLRTPAWNKRAAA